MCGSKKVYNFGWPYTDQSPNIILRVVEFCVLVAYHIRIGYHIAGNVAGENIGKLMANRQSFLSQIIIHQSFLLPMFSAIRCIQK